MPTIVRLIWVLCITGFLGIAHAAPIHTVTWKAKNVDPGTEVTLGGQSLVLVRMPLQPFSGSQRYAVSFLAPVDQFFGGLSATLTTQHSKDPLEDPIEIDGFDATVIVSDGRNYTLGPTPTPPFDTTSFSVTAHANCTVQVKVGAETILSFFQFFTTEQQPPTEIGETPDALPLADWEAYRHPNALIQACDDWIDYIRIKKVETRAGETSSGWGRPRGTSLAPRRMTGVPPECAFLYTDHQDVSQRTV